MIEGSIWRSMIAFAVPIFLGNLFQQFYNAADALIVGNFIGKEALAAVSSSSNLIFMFTGFLNGVAMGAGVLIARFYGAKSYDRLRTAVHTALTFGFIAGVILSVIGVVLSPQILRWMGTPENVLPSSIDGIVTGCILAVGRIVGESAALLFTAGVGTVIAKNVFAAFSRSGGTLSVALYMYVSERGEFDVGYAIAAILMLLVLGLNAATRLVRNRMKKKEGAQ